MTLAEVEKCTQQTHIYAQPVDAAETSSPWLTASSSTTIGLKKVIGLSPYKAHSGACTWLNAVYWLEVKESRPDGKLVIRNLSDIGREKARQVTRAVEPDLVYPLLRGRDVARWQANPSVHILLSQNHETRTGIDEVWLKTRLAETYAFLQEFRNELLDRSGYKKFFRESDAPFYTIYNVGPYTMKPYKVGWARENVILRCSVFSQAPFGVATKIIIPDQTVQFIDFNNEIEAHFVCAALNSAPAVLLPLSYTTDITAHILTVIGVPCFDADNPIHVQMSVLSQRAHQSALQGIGAKNELQQIDEELDLKAAELWGITPEELAEIRRSLNELK